VKGGLNFQWLDYPKLKTKVKIKWKVGLKWRKGAEKVL
jgi:hypothetical protein